MTARNDKMMPPDSASLWSLAEAVCLGKATDEQYETLNMLLLADKDAALFYATYLRMHGRLLWHWQRRHCRQPSDVAETSASPPSALPGFLGATLHGSVGYFFSSDWPVAYLIATVIFGVGLLIGSLVPVSQPEQVASQSDPLSFRERGRG